MVIRPSVRVLTAVVSVFIAALVIVAGARSHFVFFSFVVPALCAYFLFGWLLLARLVVRWRYNLNRDKFIEHTATFTNESVSTSSATTDIRLTWDQLTSIVATPRGLLFIIPPRNIWFWLPQHLFEDQPDNAFFVATQGGNL